MLPGDVDVRADDVFSSQGQLYFANNNTDSDDTKLSVWILRVTGRWTQLEVLLAYCSFAFIDIFDDIGVRYCTQATVIRVDLC